MKKPIFIAVPRGRIITECKRILNKTKSIKDWKDLYRIYPETAQLVYDLYKKDFEHFGFQIITP